MNAIGTAVIVTTCGGEFRGKVVGYSRTFYDTEEKLYKVSGPKIVTTTRTVELDNGRKLITGDWCPRCEQRGDCCLSDSKYTILAISKWA